MKNIIRKRRYIAALSNGKIYFPVIYIISSIFILFSGIVTNSFTLRLFLKEEHIMVFFSNFMVK